MLTLVTTTDNDLLGILAENEVLHQRVDSLQEAITSAPDESGILLLADAYPDAATTVDLEALTKAREAGHRVYIEYPDRLPDIEVGPPADTTWERLAVASDVFPGLEHLRILMAHGCRYVEVAAEAPHIVSGRVAGFDHAVYGIPDGAAPILFEHPAGNLLVATTRLSQVRTGRFAPAEAWCAVWTWALSWLAGESLPSLTWDPTVRPTFASADPLPTDAETTAFARGLDWFNKSRLLVHPDWKAEADRRVTEFPDGTGPGPDAGWPQGDGSLGVIEGASAGIHHDGAQDWRWFLRNDCMGESSMAFAFQHRIQDDPVSGRIAANINNYIYVDSDFAGGPRGNPDSPSYGLVRWTNVDDHNGVYYGDDNARSALGTIAAAALLPDTRWDRPLLRCLLANLRTTGPLGFRSGRLVDTDLQEKGWRHFWENERTHIAPHYECWLWAAFLWAYDRTGYAPFLERPYRAIRTTMEGYPDEWRWTNGLQQERARMLLTLAWLVRVDDTAEHRAWLRTVADDLLALQDDCGAIREALGESDKGRYGVPATNEAYGTNEAPLIQANGDPLCDLLYTTNFAFVGLHEAHAATGDAFYRSAEDKLAAFLCRIQATSESRPELDGAWFRAFDFHRWDYWASNADHGWGAWSIESGWTQAWIASVLAMRKLDTSFWDLTKTSRMSEHIDDLAAEMLPGI